MTIEDGPADERHPSPAQFEVLVPPPPDGSTRARLGRLTLPHGVVETPQFMPVGTNATVKALSPDDIREVEAVVPDAATVKEMLSTARICVVQVGQNERP